MYDLEDLFFKSFKKCWKSFKFKKMLPYEKLIFLTRKIMGVKISNILNKFCHKATILIFFFLIVF